MRGKVCLLIVGFPLAAQGEAVGMDDSSELMRAKGSFEITMKPPPSRFP